jgi:hypothetical protein
VGALVGVGILMIVGAVTVARDHNNTADSGMRHVDQRVDGEGEDRGSLGLSVHSVGFICLSPTPCAFQDIHNWGARR